MDTSWGTTSASYILKCEATSDTDSTLIPYRYSYTGSPLCETDGSSGTSTISLGWGEEFECSGDSSCPYAVRKSYDGQPFFSAEENNVICIDKADEPSSIEVYGVDSCVNSRLASCTSESITVLYSNSECGGDALVGVTSITAGCDQDTGTTIEIVCSGGNRVQIMIALFIVALLSIFVY